jgi:hypothetical protein
VELFNALTVGIALPKEMGPFVIFWRAARGHGGGQNRKVTAARMR